VERHCLGLFGGTFDPPHNGHVAALLAAGRTGRYEKILVTVAGEPWQKEGARTISPAPQRFAMALAAFSGLNGVEVSDREIRRPGPTYTIDTVEELIAEGWSVELLVGSDAANGLDEWRDAERLAAHVRVGVFPRADVEIILGPRWSYEILAMEPVDLSSTWLREQVRTGEPLERFVPPAVIPILKPARG